MKDVRIFIHFTDAKYIIVNFQGATACSRFEQDMVLNFRSEVVITDDEKL